MIYVFDIDGTLTPSRGTMVDDFADFFRTFFKDRRYCFVTGSDYVKVQEQLPQDIIDRSEIIFCCSGNSIWIKDKEIYKSDWQPDQDLIMFLENELLYSTWEHPTSNHIEIRTGLLNFSTVGRDCNQLMRETYNQWDSVNHERKKIADRIKKRFPDINAELGGEISIDIYPLGRDKSQIIDHLEKSTIYFFGDKMIEGGNDYPLAKRIVDNNLGKCYNVTNWIETQNILQNII